MKKWIVLFFILMFFLYILSSRFESRADKIPTPPPLKEDPALYTYLFEIYDNLHRLEIVTTNPDGVRNGKKGDCVMLQTGGASYLECNSDSITTWLGVQLLNTP